MVAGVITEGLGLALLALGAPPSAQSVPVPPDSTPASSFDLAVHRSAQPARPARMNTRSEWIGPVAKRSFTVSDEWVPPAKRWGSDAAGPVVELGALGSRYSWQPDLLHVSLDWHF